ncbi:MAG: cytochrome-c peroxidase [Candidatus Promineifilaceae bacterium]
MRRAWLALLVMAGLAAAGCAGRPAWSEQEIARLRGLWVGALGPPPPQPSNRVADDPRAAALGQRLFFDKRFSANGQVACVTCHQPERNFQDSMTLAQGLSLSQRRTQSVIGAAYSPWLFWDGRKDSLWAQALEPLESAAEHGTDRTRYAHLIAAHYRAEYEALFGPLPPFDSYPANAGPNAGPAAQAAWQAMPAEGQNAVNQVLANAGKAIAAYERLLRPGPAPFDAYLEATLAGRPDEAAGQLSPEEVAGLRLFIGPAGCVNCHSGPLLTDNAFHNTGVPPLGTLPADPGRQLGAALVLSDEFNCLSPYSDADPQACGRLRALMVEGQAPAGAFRTPSLRNVVERAPYMHAGQFITLGEVVAHYNAAPPAALGRTELRPLALSAAEIDGLVAFLRSLSGPPAADPRWLQAPPLTSP